MSARFIDYGIVRNTAGSFKSGRVWGGGGGVGGVGDSSFYVPNMACRRLISPEIEGGLRCFTAYYDVSKQL